MRISPEEKEIYDVFKSKIQNIIDSSTLTDGEKLNALKSYMEDFYALENKKSGVLLMELSNAIPKTFINKTKLLLHWFKITGVGKK